MYAKHAFHILEGIGGGHIYSHFFSPSADPEEKMQLRISPALGTLQSHGILQRFMKTLQNTCNDMPVRHASGTTAVKGVEAEKAAKTFT